MSKPIHEFDELTLAELSGDDKLVTDHSSSGSYSTKSIKCSDLVDSIAKLASNLTDQLAGSDFVLISRNNKLYKIDIDSIVPGQSVNLIPLTVNKSGTTVAPSGYAYSQVTVPVGTVNDPVASKGTVSNHSKTVTPSVTVVAGYVSGGTKTGAAVIVTASELVSGNKSITSNGTGIDVANYATVDVNVPGGGGTINNQNKTVTPTTSQQLVTCDSGYTGLGTVTVEAVTNSIDSNISANNIKNGVTILGVTGTYSGNNQNKSSEVLTTLPQTITYDSGYTGLGAVTITSIQGGSSIDPNLVPEKIKSGETILGVTGTYRGTLDISSTNYGLYSSNLNKKFCIGKTGNELLDFPFTNIDIIVSNVVEGNSNHISDVLFNNCNIYITGSVTMSVAGGILHITGNGEDIYLSRTLTCLGSQVTYLKFYYARSGGNYTKSASLVNNSWVIEDL